MARLAVRVQPKARDRWLVGWMADGTLKLRVREPAEAGAANAAVAELIAEVAGVRIAAVRLVRGQTARAKVIEVEGLDDAELRRRIERKMRDGQ
jgi:hypothetical protein